MFDFIKKVAKNPIVRSVAKKGLEYAPGIYHNLTKRVKNKTLKKNKSRRCSFSFE